MFLNCTDIDYNGDSYSRVLDLVLMPSRKSVTVCRLAYEPHYLDSEVLVQLLEKLHQFQYERFLVKGVFPDNTVHIH